MFSVLRDEIVIAHSQWVTVDQPAPDFSGPGVSALKTISGVVMALALTALVIGGIVAGGMIAFGHFARHSELQSKGLKGVILVIVGAAIVGGIAGLINWGSGLKVA